MKSLIKLMLLMGLTVSLNLWSMSKQSLGKKASLTEEKEKEELVQIKTIEFPNKGLRKPAILNINEKEPLTSKTFAELIENKARKNELFILARVTTVIGDTLDIHYFDAHALNRRLFGKYPLTRLPIESINPINRQQIKIIEYFTIKKNEHLQELKKHLPEVLGNIVMDYQECFEFLCTNTELLYSDGNYILLRYFYLNSDELDRDIVIELINQGSEYFNLSDYQKAKEYFEKSATPEVKNINLSVWATANNILGKIYFEGCLGAPDYQKAKEYYEKVAIPEVKNANLEIWATANNILGKIYYYGKLGAPYYQKAKEFWEKIAIPEVKNANLFAWVNANISLGLIYYYGTLGAPDYKKAKEYWEKVATDEVKNVNLAVWADANNILGKIYFYRKLGEADYKKAKEYLEKVATDEVKNVNLALWADANSSLGLIYYLGKLGAPDYKRAKEYWEKVAIDEVKNQDLGTWNYAKKMLEELEKIAKEESAESELVN